jgi:hypothetical protein
MSLFTASPVVVSDGTSDHTFTFRAQLPDTKSVVGEYTEPAADSDANSKLLVKQDESSKTKRKRLFSRRFDLVISDGVTFEPVTINYSIAYDKRHDEDVIEALGHNVTVACLSKTEFFSNFSEGHI